MSTISGEVHTLVLLLIDKRAIGGTKPDMGIFGQNMVLAAHSLGLGTCYIDLVTRTLACSEAAARSPASPTRVGYGWMASMLGLSKDAAVEAKNLQRSRGKPLPQMRNSVPSLRTQLAVNGRNL